MSLLTLCLLKEEVYKEQIWCQIRALSFIQCSLIKKKSKMKENMKNLYTFLINSPLAHSLLLKLMLHFKEGTKIKWLSQTDDMQEILVSVFAFWKVEQVRRTESRVDVIRERDTSSCKKCKVGDVCLNQDL